MNFKKIKSITIISLIVGPVLSIAYSFSSSETIQRPLPEVAYRLQTRLLVRGHGEALNIKTYLPVNSSRQTILQEKNLSPEFYFSSITDDKGNRVSSWKTSALSGPAEIIWQGLVRGQHIQYQLSEKLRLPVNQKYPLSLQPFLASEKGVPINHPEIIKKLNQLVPDKNIPLKDILWTLHRYLQDELDNKNFSGYTSALTALRLGEASCNGKSRLFAAFVRRLGLPARLVGGLLLKSGSKRTSHQWLEIYIRGHWIPFDTINDRFAEITERYLTLYYGDKALFTHSPDINFKYMFTISRRLISSQVDPLSAGELDLVSLFKRAGIDVSILSYLLMVPWATLILVLYRNVIGLPTFGTFLPVLIAYAFKGTGLIWGLTAVLVLLLATAAAHRLLNRFRLLHTPKLAVMLTIVVILMLALVAFSEYVGFASLAHLAVFPIAILAMTAERFALMTEEDGFKQSALILLSTLLAVSLCYLTMASSAMQALMTGFPEILVAVIGINLILGSWSGIRLVEYFRFQPVLSSGDHV